MGLILIILVILLLFGGFGIVGGIPYGYGAGHTGIGVLGIILIVIVVLALMGRI